MTYTQIVKAKCQRARTSILGCRQDPTKRTRQPALAKTREKSLITPAKSCMSKLTDIPTLCDLEEGTIMRRSVSFYVGLACASVIVFVSSYISTPVKNTSDHGQSLLSVTPALAQTRPKEAVAPREDIKIPSAQESNLMHNLLEKQKELDNREKALKEEEQKIDLLKKDVAEKMEALRVLEERMSPALENQKGEKDKKYQSLAKIYEVTPPERAAAIFEKMDRKMAAEIMLRMNSKKAGAVWAHINHDIGVQIAREITSSQSVDAAKAAKIAKEITGAEVSKPEVPQSPDAGAAITSEATEEEVIKQEKERISDAAATTGAVKDIDGSRAVKPETEQKDGTKSAQKREMKVAKSKKAKFKNARPEALKPFAIQIKAVRGIEMATEFTKVLKEEGIDAYWSEMSAKDGGTLYRILVGHFASREEALAYMKKNRIEISYPGSYIQKNAEAVSKKEKKGK